MKFTFNITASEMLRSFLQRHHFSKRTISAIKHNGALVVNGQTVTVRKQLAIGDILEVYLGKEIPSTNLKPYQQPLNILFEDDYLIVVSKPPYQNCAPSRDHLHYSIVEQVLGYLNEKQPGINPHIVTRLDRNTSGIVILAKHGFIHHLMSNLNIDKKYLCICYGKTEKEGVIDAPIARHPESIIQRRVDAAGKTAQTRFKRVEYKEGFSMCEVTLLTGRTHQIRVHFQHIGHSIVGDALYGGKHESYHHQLLRCTQVAFIHPIKNQNIVINDKYDAIETLFNMI
ncbi:RNA pseudouridine synthase [Staphylococcus saprophyticus]|jgi:23S rRNA pseudouridine1911/1915/1917 synthase|uniref:Pseudouridine synthase n=4 Tax=Staphylococcaceae TaxID=90964 RepID=Q49WD7_STAS1|nr:MULTISPECIES: RluA family pseudouridine synthase [Staphylococcus]CRV23937.1 23S_rRNA pseudouridine synthase [Streptococcus equi subsp. equi]AMG20858.1 RluA family pseudouridine synthase [Staphylococcus saprophyticus]AMG33928.1 RluA family pseudouridine synthase [Staphylococcus saprophyticus]ASE59770.1 RluA family pseudouridine synthase [Staphylococcus saprophyticus]ASF18573.1 RluA family pseudouridine synthase [Staphylococcus saprophyticus]